MRPKKNIIKIFLDTGKCCVTLCYTIFSLISQSAIFLPGPLLFSGIGLWFLGSWSWGLELSRLELPGSCPGFGLLYLGLLDLQTWYDWSTIIYMNLKINIMTSYFNTKTPNIFQIIYSDKFKMYDFTVLNNNKVIYHYHFKNLKDINKLIQQYK